MTIRLFTSWVRRGAAAGILEAEPEHGDYAGPATFRPSVVLARDGVPGAPVGGAELPLIGPEAVLGIDPGAILRTDPAPGATGVEKNFLPLVELRRPDLPWLFTPASPNAKNRLRPWLVLVVVEAALASLQPGKPLPRISVPDSELPDLDDAWAWAHVQVTVDDPGTAVQALQASEGGAALSRLLCPRRLQADTAYLACIVPATRAGALAGLGLPPDPGPALQRAWTAGAGASVELPVYYSWTFSTGDSGDFESLVERLRGVRADGVSGFGTRPINLSAPWQSPPQLDAGSTIDLGGALGIGDDKARVLPDPARAAFETRLAGLLNFPADRLGGTVDPALSAVAPPIYGARHAGAVRVPATPGWLQSLNLEPRRRIAAAFGAQYVQQHKEFLVARAWDQLGPVREANRLRALAELASEVGDSLHQRHVLNRPTADLVSLAAPARTRVLALGSDTLQATADSTPLPAGTQTVAFRRLARPLGPLGRRAFAGSPSTALARGLGEGAALAVHPPSLRLDGITSLLAEPVLSPQDGSLALVSRAWAAVTSNDESISNPSNLQTIRNALTRPIGSNAAGPGLAGKTPIVLAPPRSRQFASVPKLVTGLLQALQPSAGILGRLADRVRVPAALDSGDPTRRVMASPQFPAPLALALLQDHPDYLLPGLGRFPDDRVTLLEAQPAFVEAFLAGANQQMNRELLWRDYPSDPRGTPFRHFWPRPASQPDILPMTNWPVTTALGQNGGGIGAAIEQMVVLLVRGEVLRRYPRTIAYAAPGTIAVQPDGSKQLALDLSKPWAAPTLLMKIDASTTAFGYTDMTADQLRSNIGAGVAGWYFVFSEAVTGTRFNFDDRKADDPKPDPPPTWTDLDWKDVPQSRGFAIASDDVPTPAGETTPPVALWNNDAADMARIAYARPFRIGYHADELLAF